MKCTVKFCMLMKSIDEISCKSMIGNTDKILEVLLQHLDKKINMGVDLCLYFFYLLQFYLFSRPV